MKRLVCILLLVAAAAPARKKPAKAEVSPLDRYVAEAKARQAAVVPPTPGTIWIPGSRLMDIARDVRASQVDDVVTIIVDEQASAVAGGTTKTARVSSSKNSIGALGGLTNPAGRWANLANTSGDTELNGQGTTSRTTSISTNLSARVIAVLPNGDLVVEASRDISVNSERQIMTLRGVVRPADLDLFNTVPSNRVAQMEIQINGKGVVGDAIRRPFFLYRLLLGLLPF